MIGWEGGDCLQHYCHEKVTFLNKKYNLEKCGCEVKSDFWKKLAEIKTITVTIKIRMMT